MTDRPPGDVALTEQVSKAAQFLVSKGYRDAASISSVAVVDLLCEFAALSRLQPTADGAGISEFHLAWGYAHDHPAECAQGYDKKAFGHVQFWLEKVRPHGADGAGGESARIRAEAFEEAAKIADEWAAAENAEMEKPDFPKREGPIFLRGYAIADGIAAAIRARTVEPKPERVEHSATGEG